MSNDGLAPLCPLGVTVMSSLSTQTTVPRHRSLRWKLSMNVALVMTLFTNSHPCRTYPVSLLLCTAKTTVDELSAPMSVILRGRCFSHIYFSALRHQPVMRLRQLLFLALKSMILLMSILWMVHQKRSQSSLTKKIQASPVVLELMVSTKSVRMAKHSIITC